MPPPLSDDAQGSKPKPNLNMSLHDLPAPSFKAGPLGGRSVPALEKSNLFASSDSDSTALVAGTLTPGAGGAMGMGRDPWNVFGSEEPKATASASAWQDTPKDAKLDALARPTSTLARSSSYNGDSGHLKDPRSKPPLQRADTQQKPQERQQQPSPSETNGGGDDVLAANLAHLSLQPSQPPPQPQWVDKATAYPDPNAFYSPAAFANDVHPQQPQYDVFRRDAAYTVDYTQQPGGPRRVQSAGWQLPVLGGGDQRINNRSPSNTRPPYAPPSNPMSRTASASSLYGLASTQLANPNALMYQHQQPAINSQFYNPAMFSPAAPQSRNLPTPHNYARSAYDAPSPIVDYAAYGTNFQPPSVASSTHSSYHDYGGGMPGAMRYEDRVRSVRSPLLEEFRANRHRRWDLSDIRGHVVEFSGDQLGSRHLQSKLDSATVEDKRLFFEEMMPNVLALSTDLFSNYVVQKAFEIADHNQKLSLVKALEGNVLQLSLQMYGCRVVQKALECVLVDEQTVICNELKGNVLKCARDQNANHVLQRVLERVPADRIKFIPEACEGQVYSLATHPYGCRVLQRILENISDVRPLIDELLKHTQTLMQDQYANYVIQHLLERGTQADRSVIVSHVRGQVVHFSKHKFASNVIDKVILCADENERRALTDEILYDPSAISNMLKDQFANYCLQKFMLVVTGPQREPLISQVADALLTIRKYSGTYSKHLLAIEKYIQNEQAMNQYNAQMAAAGVDPSMIPLR